VGRRRGGGRADWHRLPTPLWLRHRGPALDARHRHVSERDGRACRLLLRRSPLSAIICPY